MRNVTGLFVTLALSAGLPAVAGDCPSAVVSAVGNAHAGAKVVDCKQETEDGATVYAVKIRTVHGKKLELDVLPDGAILVTEERVEISQVPAAVLETLHGKFADAKVKDAERLTSADGEISYEVTFTSGKAEKSMTVTAAGALVEIESDDEEDADAEEGD